MQKMVLAIGLLAPTVALTNPACSQLVSLSQKDRPVLEEESTFNAQVARFCRGYAADQAGIDSPSFELGFRYLSTVIHGEQDLSSPAIASRYCDAKYSSDPSPTAYQTYLDGFSSNAGAIYAQCQGLAEEGIHVNLDAASVLPARFSLTVSYEPKNKDNNALLKAIPADGVTCKWLDGKGDSIILRSGQGTLMDCMRKNAADTTFVRVAQMNGGKVKTLTIPWIGAKGTTLNTTSSESVSGGEQAAPETPIIIKRTASPETEINVIENDDASLDPSTRRPTSQREAPPSIMDNGTRVTPIESPDISTDQPASNEQ